MNADERFIAGEDRLCALLRQVPAFAPPASLEAAVMAAARAEQAARNAPAPLPPTALPPKVRAYAEQADAPADNDGQDFTPPAGLQASVMAQAARLQAAQAPRRNAVLEEVRRGDAPQSVLGAPVGEAAQAWLREQATQQALDEQVAKPARGRRAWRWWPALGVLAGTLGVGVVSLQIVLRQLDLRGGEITLPANVPAPVTDKPAKQAVVPKPATEAPLQPAAPAPQAEAAGEPASPRADAQAPPPPAQPAPAQASPSAPANAQPHRAHPAEAQAKAAPREADVLAQQRAPAPKESAPGVTRSLQPGAPPVPAMRAPAPMAAIAPPAPIAPIAPIPQIAPPAPAPAIEAPRFALRASPSPQADAPRAPAPAVQGQRLGTWTMSLREEPQLAVERLLSAPSGAAPAAGALLALRVTAAAPASPEVRAWVERLWQAVPAEYRPALPYAVQADSTLPPATVRIERQADSAP